MFVGITGNYQQPEFLAKIRGFNGHRNYTAITGDYRQLIFSA